MSRFVVLFFTFLYFLAGSRIYAAPTHEISARQLGNLQCNLDRLKIVTTLASLQGTLKDIVGGGDATAAESIKAVQDNISGAQGAIGVIGKALITGQKAPAEARDQVLNNLTDATAALGNITSTDEGVTASLEKATTQLTNSILAGEGVVANCK
ncbi:hypothetical protein C8Q74DRAFT_1203295 [Fomes fomentarius]|nr:hypothetical protein C8Q74DRAFT_1203295 [Fomes fomentarius]